MLEIQLPLNTLSLVLNRVRALAKEKDSNMTTITLSREELYEQVWERPLIHLAEKFGISDRGLGKRCTRLEIPLPGRGYWRKIELGQSVEKEELSPASKDCPRSADFWLERAIHKNTFVKVPLIQEIKERELKPENLIIIPEKISRLHPLAKQTLASLLKTEPDKYGRCYPSAESLDIGCSRKTAKRATYILHVLIREAEKRGYSTSIHRYTAYCSQNTNPYGTFIHCYGQDVRISLMEKVKKVPRIIPKEQLKNYWGAKEDFVPTGQLSLKIENFPYYVGRHKRNWVDTDTKLLEEQLNSFMVGLVTASVCIHQESERKKQEEEERMKQREYEELRRQKQLEEQNRIHHLEEVLSRWIEANHLRKFLQIVKENSINLAYEDMPMDTWLTWAESYANKIDPCFPKTDLRHTEILG